MQGCCCTRRTSRHLSCLRSRSKPQTNLKGHHSQGTSSRRRRPRRSEKARRHRCTRSTGIKRFTQAVTGGGNEGREGRREGKRKAISSATAASYHARLDKKDHATRPLYDILRQCVPSQELPRVLLTDVGAAFYVSCIGNRHRNHGIGTIIWRFIHTVSYRLYWSPHQPGVGGSTGACFACPIVLDIQAGRFVQNVSINRLCRKRDVNSNALSPRLTALETDSHRCMYHSVTENQQLQFKTTSRCIHHSRENGRCQ